MCDRLRASFIESSFFGSRRFQAGLSYLPPLSVKPLRVAPAKPGVYLWELNDQWNIYVRPYPNVDDSRTPVSVRGGRHPLWDPRGRNELYYRNLDGGMMAASVELSSEFRVLDVTELFPNSGNYRGPGGSGWSYDVSPRDGRFVLQRFAEDRSGNGAMIRVTLNWFEELRELMRVR